VAFEEGSDLDPASVLQDGAALGQLSSGIEGRRIGRDCSRAVLVEPRWASAQASLPGASAASWVGQRSRLTLARRAVKRQTG